MRLLDRLILGEVAAATATATGGCVFVLTAGNLFKQVIGELAAGRIDGLQALELIALLLPGVLPYALPLGVLTGMLIAFGRLGAQNELTAMRAAGTSLLRLATPALLFAGLLASLSVLINLEIAPRANDAYRELLKGTVARNPIAAIIPGELSKAFPNTILRTEARDGDRLTGLSLWRLDDEGRIIQSLQAKEAVVRVVDEASGERKLMIEASGARIERRNPEATDGRAGNFTQLERAIVEIPLVAGEAFTRKLRWMTTAELEVMRTTGEPAQRLEATRQLHTHAAGGIAVWALALLAIPLSLRVGRSETLVNAAIALVVALLYYLLTAIATWIPLEAASPEVVAWAPTVVVMAVGGFFFWRAARR